MMIGTQSQAEPQEAGYGQHSQGVTALTTGVLRLASRCIATTKSSICVSQIIPILQEQPHLNGVLFKGSL